MLKLDSDSMGLKAVKGPEYFHNYKQKEHDGTPRASDHGLAGGRAGKCKLLAAGQQELVTSAGSPSPGMPRVELLRRLCHSLGNIFFKWKKMLRCQKKILCF